MFYDLSPGLEKSTEHQGTDFIFPYYAGPQGDF